MDVVCARCGEPWDIHHVLHDEPQSFERRGCLIGRCPCCPERVALDDAALRTRLRSIRVLAVIHGDDLDAFACALQDYRLL